MKAKITIELTTEIADTSELPDIAAEGEFLKQQLAGLEGTEVTAKDGTEAKISDKYEVTRISVDVLV